MEDAAELAVGPTGLKFDFSDGGNVGLGEG
jgi:hypothetical protein